MKCPYCDHEMEKGIATFSLLQTMGHIVVSYTSETETDKRFFQRKTTDKILLFGEEAAAYYCPVCSKLLPVFDMET